MLTDRVSQWIAAVTGAAIASAAELPGATSSLIAAICLTDGREFVLRLHTKDDWLALEPDVAVREASALTVLQTTGVAAPQLVAVDPDGASCGRPALLMSRLVGRADLSDASNSRVRALADALRPLHALRAPAELPAYRRYVEPGQHVVPTWATDPGLWETAFAVCAVAAPPGTTCLIHRDSHPGNVLIDDGAVAGIVDWVNACDGPPEVDIAHCRLNLALTHGLPSADEFATACTHP